MAPALVRLHNFELGEPSTSTFTRETGAMPVLSTIYSRSIQDNSSSSSSSGGVEENTIIFIVVGVVCLFVILIGFYFVSRPRAASNAASSSHPQQHSPIIHSPRLRPERDRSECWKIWKVWRHTSNTDPPTAASTPTSQVSPAPATITRPSRIIPARGSSKTYPPITPRPQQARRVTSLSVTTSFSHSHITQEELNNFRLSAYDLDGDLETEMLNSARDDVWPGHVLAVGEGCGSVGIEEAMEARGNATPIMEGSVESYVPCATQWDGGDYESSGACPTVASGSNGVEGDEVGRTAMERQALQ